MRITCPKCEFKGLIDSAPLAFETHVACVRCGTTFEAMLVEGEIKTNLLPDDYEKFLAPLSASEVNTEALPLPSAATDAEDVLALPHTPEVSYQAGEPESALEDVLLVSPAYAEPAEPENVPVCQIEETPATEPATAEAMCSPQSADESHSQMAVETADEPSFNFSAQGEAAADYDKHGMGTRLMHISPLWLVICGMTFVAVIVLSNQFAKPAEQNESVASNFTSPSNKATNQTLSQPPAPASTNPAATSVQDSSQMGAPETVELKKEAEAVEAKAETKTQEELKPTASASVAPEAETKQSAPVPVPQAQNAEGGGYTIQIGSYNVIEQANERVARLQATGFDARVVAVELPKRGTWYRVQAGRFSNREEAARYGSELKSRGAADSFIIAEAQGGK
jgi:cell division protein FtsN